MKEKSLISLTCLLILYILPCYSQAVTSTYSLSQEDDNFLDRLERASFLYFWEQADSESGQVRDRAVSNGINEARPVSSTAATGFGLTSLCIAHWRGYMDKSQIETRITKTLNFILNKLEGAQGFYYHFIDLQTGKRVWNCEVSTIDTALLMNGVITVREYFKNSNTNLRDLAQNIYDRANYSWFYNQTSGVISMGWTPEKGMLDGDATWNRYCELMMLLLQAVGTKSSNAVPAAKLWSSFKRQVLTYKNMSYITTGAPIFIHQYSHAWFDFRGRHDAYTNYFENSITATKVHKQWSLDYLAPKFPGAYSDVQWGVSASDSAKGYLAWGGPNFNGADLDGTIDGSIVPCAAGGSLVFLPNETLAVLKHINATYPNVWSRYGFIDAFNPLTNWYNPDVLGIDAGITLLMAENLRTGFVWNYFMQNDQMKRAMNLVGLVSDANLFSYSFFTIFSLLILNLYSNFFII